MKRKVIAFTLLVIAVPLHPAQGVSMWGCAPVGERRNILYLVDREARSYIKYSGQRIPAKLTMTGSERTWRFGDNAFVLNEEGFAEYHERGAVKSRFKCKSMK